MRYEYKVVPAPERGEKAKGVKGADGRFANAVERIMNDMAARGWEYQRCETLPSEERSGLTQSVTVWRNLLVFRRPHPADVSRFAPKMLEPPLVLTSMSAPEPEAAPETPEVAPAIADQPTPAPAKTALQPGDEAEPTRAARNPVEAARAMLASGPVKIRTVPPPPQEPVAEVPAPEQQPELFEAHAEPEPVAEEAIADVPDTATGDIPPDTPATEAQPETVSPDPVAEPVEEPPVEPLAGEAPEPDPKPAPEPAPKQAAPETVEETPAPKPAAPAKVQAPAEASRLDQLLDDLTEAAEPPKGEAPAPAEKPAAEPSAFPLRRSANKRTARAARKQAAMAAAPSYDDDESEAAPAPRALPNALMARAARLRQSKR